MDFGFPDHSACPLGLLFQIVEAMKKWLDADEENVAVVHCLAGRQFEIRRCAKFADLSYPIGRGRTGMVISTYLLREGFFRDAKVRLLGREDVTIWVLTAVLLLGGTQILCRDALGHSSRRSDAVPNSLRSLCK